MKKIRNKILFTMMLLTLLPVLLIGGYSFYTTTEALREVALKDQQNQLLNDKQRLEGLLQEAERRVYALLDSSDIQLSYQGKQSFTDLSGGLERFLNQNNTFSAVRLLDFSGKEMAYSARESDGSVTSASSEKLLDQSQSGYFKAGMSLKKAGIYISPIELKRVNGDIVTPHQSRIRYATRVDSADGRIQGVLVVELNLDSLMSDVFGDEQSEWKTLLADPEGFLYYSDDANDSLAVSGSDQANIFEGDASSLLAIKGSSAEQSIESDTDVSLSRPISIGAERDSLGYLVSVTSKATLYKPLQDYLSISVVIIIVCLFLSFLFAIILSNSLSEPLLRLTEKVKNFSQGDLETPINAEVKNEIGDLSQAMELLRKSMVILMKRSRKA